MKQRISRVIDKAQQAVTRLIEHCRKDGRLYAIKPKIVAQVNRTAKWLLNAIKQLAHELGSHGDKAAS